MVLAKSLHVLNPEVSGLSKNKVCKVCAAKMCPWEGYAEECFISRVGWWWWKWFV